MDKKKMMQEVFNQLSIDYNCSPDDFMKDGIIFTEAKELEGRRPYPFITPRLELITFGNGVVANSSSGILEIVQDRLRGKSRYDILNMPFVYGVNPYYLPDLDNISLLHNNKNFEFTVIERTDILSLYELKGFDYALQYDMNSLHPEEVAVVAKQNGNIVGIASAVSECKTMWQINVDVISCYRGNNLATIMVNMLTLEVLKRGYIPYYSTDCGNVISQRVAIKAGYLPRWSHCFRTRINLLK